MSLKPPFSPELLIQSVDAKINAIRTTSLDFSFNELVDMHSSGELIIAPDFQRMFRWTPAAQSRFIESLLLELPIPPIFLIEREDRIYELIDGLQRISSFLHFRGELVVDGKRSSPLVLTDCDIVTELNGCTKDTLPRPLEIKLKRSYIRAEILRKESDNRLRYHMFKRLNTGGESLSEQEIRNATIRLLSDTFHLFVVRMSSTEDFEYCVKIVSENQKRQKFDQELALRFFAFKNKFEEYRHDVADFLTEYLEEVSDPETNVEFDYAAEEATFEKTFRALRLIDENLGWNGKIFGSGMSGAKPRGQFSVYHFEGLTLGIQSVIDLVDLDNEAHIEKLAQVVKNGKSDSDFSAHVGGGKNQRSELRARVAYFSSRFEAALG